VLYIFGYVSAHRVRICKEKSIFLPRSLEPDTCQIKKTLNKKTNILVLFLIDSARKHFFFSRHFFVKTLSHFFPTFFFF
jgi:hypothetical protein